MKTPLSNMRKLRKQIDKETVEFWIESLIQNNILEKKPFNRVDSYFFKGKMSDLSVDIEQQNALLANPATSEPKDIRIDNSKNNEYEPSNIATEELSVELIALNVFVKEQSYIHAVPQISAAPLGIQT